MHGVPCSGKTLRLRDLMFVTCADCNIPGPEIGSQPARLPTGSFGSALEGTISSKMRIIAAFLTIIITACAPEPNTPADSSLQGTWTSSASLFTFSGMRMNLVQEPQGIVSGTWLAKTSGGTCASPTPCDAVGEVIGRNTVSQVEMQLLGAGRFEGVLLEANRLRGIFAVGEAFDTITFVRTGQ